jgi:hypothetical protein
MLHAARRGAHTVPTTSSAICTLACEEASRTWLPAVTGLQPRRGGRAPARRGPWCGRSHRRGSHRPRRGRRGCRQERWDDGGREGRARMRLSCAQASYGLAGSERPGERIDDCFFFTSVLERGVGETGMLRRGARERD